MQQPDKTGRAPGRAAKAVRTRRSILAGALAALTAACGPSVHRTLLGPAYPPLSPDAEVRVSTRPEARCPFEELGLVTIRDSEFNSERDFLPRLKEEARALGGDGVIGLRHVPPVEEDEVWAGLEGTVIRFTNPECRE